MLPRFHCPPISLAQRALPLLVMVIFLLTGCQRDTPSPRGRSEANDGAVANTRQLKIFVSVSGEITADGNPVALDQLAAKLAELKQASGGVWYCRENPLAEPHPNAMKVMKMVVDNKLPIRLSTKPDFSDIVDDNGVARSGSK
jgi:biopolymer transport protein ExbD